MGYMTVPEVFGGAERAFADDAMHRVNLDANANAAVTQRVLEAVTDALTGAMNPSSAHQGGTAARRHLTRARDAVAALAEGILDDGVIFTSGCTEANNMVVNAARSSGAALITSSVEHASLMTPARALATNGGVVHFVPVDANGIIDLGILEELLGAVDGPVVLSVQVANSETGVVQPIETVAQIVAKRPETVFHSDAAQSFGKIPLRIGRGVGPTVATISGHKLHAPMGVGALLLAPGEDRISPFLLGGEQQGGTRAGTEPLALIAGFGAACDERAERFDKDVAHMRALRDRLELGVTSALSAAAVNGGGSRRLPNTTSIHLPGVEAMAMVARLDAEGVLASQGSACSSMRPTPSPVLLAMGMSEDRAFSTVRFSTSPLNTEDEIDAAIAIIAATYRMLGDLA